MTGAFREKKAEHIIAVFGAGASRACGGVALTQVLPKAFNREGAKEESWYPFLTNFLNDVFSVATESFDLTERLPDLGLVLSVVDMVVEQNRGIISQNRADSERGAREVSRRYWSLRDLLSVRETLDGLIIKTVLDAYLTQFTTQEGGPIQLSRIKSEYPHELFLDYLHQRDPDFSLISLNYDLFLERAAMQHLAGLEETVRQGSPVAPLYHVSFEPPHDEAAIGRQLHKLHGSMDWIYCSGCGRVNLFQTKDWLTKNRDSPHAGPLALQTLDELSATLLDPDKPVLCGVCEGGMRPMIIPPTLAKNYANSHIRRIWTHAERELRRATTLYFVGYSLPIDDISVITTLKQNTQHLDRRNIHVIVPDRDAIARYRSIFGPDIRVSEQTFESWIVDNCDTMPVYRKYQDYKAARLETIAAMEAL